MSLQELAPDTGPRLLAAFLMLACQPALACMQAETLQMEMELFVPANTSSAYQIIQSGQDLGLEIRSGTDVIKLNHPNGRHGLELVFLEANAESRNVTLCVNSFYPNEGLSGQLLFEEVDALDRQPEHVIDALRSYSEAGRLWAEGNAGSKAKAIEIYERIAGQNITLMALSAQSLLNAIFANNSSYQYDRSQVLYSRHLQLLPEDSNAYYTVLKEIGYALLRQRRHAEAERILRRAVELVPDEHIYDSADVRNLLGEVLLSQGKIEEGGNVLRDALEGVSDDISVLSSLHHNMGYYFLLRSSVSGISEAQSNAFLRESINEHLVARAFAVQAGNRTELQLIENNLGSLYERTSELRRANHHYRESLKLTGEIDTPYGLRVIYQNLGALNLNLGDYLKARSYLEQSLNLAEQVRDEVSVRIRCRLGTSHRLLGQPDQAVIHHRACFDSATNLDNGLVQMEAALELARDHHAAQRLAEQSLEAFDLIPAYSREDEAQLRSEQAAQQELSHRYIRTAWSLAQELARSRYNLDFSDWSTLDENPRDQDICALESGGLTELDAIVEADSEKENELRIVMRVMVMKARMEMEQGAFSSALESAFIALKLLSNARFLEEVEALEAAMLVYDAIGETEKSRSCGYLVLTKIEALHEQLEAERNGPSWTARTHEVYVALAESMLEQYLGESGGDPEVLREAFSIIERSRAISLRQHISLSASDVDKQADAELRQAMNAVANRHAALSDQLNHGLLPVDYYHQHDLLELSRLRQQESIPIPPIASLAKIHSGLQDHQLVLYYFLTERSGFLFTISNSGFEVHDLGAAAELLALARQADSAIRLRRSDFRSALDLLAGRLLPPDLTLDRAEELIIVPHRVLHSIPFSALSPEGGDHQLVETHRLLITPSLSTYFMDRPAQKEYSSSIAVFADPVFSTQLASKTQAAVTDSSQFHLWSEQLQRLPFTEQEAKSLREIFGREDTLEFIGNSATLENLGSDAVRNARILHIATHGYFHSTSSDNVGLILSAVDESNEAVSSFVTLTELFSHSFNNELVVISGCDTAMGLQLPGEGMLGLTRGFLAQGANHVISTLWPVSDRSTYLFMTLFYQQLVQTGDVAAALQHAQNQLKNSRRYSDPYYWAPYILTSVSPHQEMKFQL